MPDVILHHYALSPFSEKVRRVLAYRQIPWAAVEQPIMAPKPDLTPLTGGYRRIPVMQIGADIYCDTALIVRELEARYSERTVLPPALAGAAAVWEDWADHRLFMLSVPGPVSDLADQLPPGFFEDRAAMTPGFNRDALIAGAPHALAQVGHLLDQLALQLGQSDYLLGDTFTLADAACFHPVRFLMNSPRLVPMIESRPALSAWVQRIEGFGAGQVEAMSGEAALDIARDATPVALEGDSVDGDGYAVGDSVTIIADDYGQETTVGVVQRIRANDLTVTRDDERVGTVAVHYPRAGYRVSRTG